MLPFYLKRLQYNINDTSDQVVKINEKQPCLGLANFLPDLRKYRFGSVWCGFTGPLAAHALL